MADFNPFAAEVINISINGANEPNYLPAPGYFLMMTDTYIPRKLLVLQSAVEQADQAMKA